MAFNFGLDAQVDTILLNCREDSTRRKWFLNFYDRSNYCHPDSALSTVFAFLLLQVYDGLSHSSVKVYLAAISSFHPDRTFSLLASVIKAVHEGTC